MKLPRLYPILDIGSVRARKLDWQMVAQEWLDAGVEMIQLRNKSGSPQEILRQAEWLSQRNASYSAVLVMNDRVDLAHMAGWPAVHLGHTDMPPDVARDLFPHAALHIGVSTHTAEQVKAAECSCAAYVAIGPVHTTGTKPDAEPVVGLAGVREARALTAKPLVAIGGLDASNADKVFQAGADAVAMIGALLSHPGGPGAAVRDFFSRLR